MYFNPALTGVNGERKISAVFRNHLPSLSRSVQSTFVSYQDGTNNFGNFGAYFMNGYYSRGTLNSNSVGLSYAKPIKIAENLAITPGISATVIYDRIDFSKLTFGDIANPKTGELYDPLKLKEHNFFGNFSSGFLVTWKNLFAGVGFNQFGSIGANSIFNTYSNIGISLSSKKHDLTVIPEFSFNTMQGFHRTDVKVSSYYKWAKLGIEYNLRDSFSTIVGAQLGNFDIAVSTEWTNSKLTDFNGFSYEAGCSYTFKKNENKTPSYKYSLF
jgi:type IX secretion system PorP/SprF family membrane protein